MHAKTVGIHQPNFFPWLGYFNKLAHADEFVFLDSVQFSKAAGTWSNRVRLQIHGEPRWVTHIFTAGGTVLNALGSEPVPFLVALRSAAEKTDTLRS